MNKTFKIPEVKIEELRKRIARVQKKCAKYSQDFHFAEVGETIEEVKIDGLTYNVKFILVEASGHAVINNWKFVATIDHTSEGNIINKGYTGIEVPERYRTSEPYCEHCSSKRYRKETYIVYNTETCEFKQIGRSCLKDYTNGLDAAHIATLLESLAYLEDSESFEGSSWNYVPKYYEPKKYLQYAIEIVKNFGYVPSGYPDSTRSRTDDYFYLLEDNWCFSESYREQLKNEIQKIKFNPMSTENAEIADKMISWIYDESIDNTDYIHNLRTIFKSEYIGPKYFGYIASVVATYNKSHKQDEVKAEPAKESNYQGNIGDKLTINVEDAQIVTSWSTQWGYTYIYKFVDADGNVFTWKTSTDVELDRKPVTTVTGIVKAHNKYRNVKQTELTRCKVA